LRNATRIVLIRLVAHGQQRGVHLTCFHVYNVKSFRRQDEVQMLAYTARHSAISLTSQRISRSNSTAPLVSTIQSAHDRSDTSDPA
jgi:hypothetical protein